MIVTIKREVIGKKGEASIAMRYDQDSKEYKVDVCIGIRRYPMVYVGRGRKEAAKEYEVYRQQLSQLNI